MEGGGGRGRKGGGRGVRTWGWVRVCACVRVRVRVRVRGVTPPPSSPLTPHPLSSVPHPLSSVPHPSPPVPHPLPLTPHLGHHLGLHGRYLSCELSSNVRLNGEFGLKIGDKARHLLGGTVYGYTGEGPWCDVL